MAVSCFAVRAMGGNFHSRLRCRCDSESASHVVIIALVPRFRRIVVLQRLPSRLGSGSSIAHCSASRAMLTRAGRTNGSGDAFWLGLVPNPASRRPSARLRVSTRDGAVARADTPEAACGVSVALWRTACSLGHRCNAIILFFMMSYQPAMPGLVLIRSSRQRIVMSSDVSRDSIRQQTELHINIRLAVQLDGDGFPRHPGASSCVFRWVHAFMRAYALEAGLYCCMTHVCFICAW